MTVLEKIAAILASDLSQDLKLEMISLITAAPQQIVVNPVIIPYYPHVPGTAAPYVPSYPTITWCMPPNEGIGSTSGLRVAQLPEWLQ